MLRLSVHRARRMDPPLTLELERFAALSAELEAGSSSEEVLAREGLSAEVWTQVQELWLGRMAEEVSRGRFELTNRYNYAFNARREGLVTSASAALEAPLVGASPDSTTGELVVPVAAPRAEPMMTLPDIPPPDEEKPSVRDRVTPTDVMEAPPLSDSPPTPRVPTMLPGQARLVPATPFVAVQEAPREDLDDAPTPAPTTEDPVAPRALISTLPPDDELPDDDDDPLTPAPPRSMGRDGEGPRFDGLPFRPPASVAPDTPPRASGPALPDILPFRAAGVAASHPPAPTQAPAPLLPAPAPAPAPMQAPAPAPLPAAAPSAAPPPPASGAQAPPPGAFPFASSAQPRHEPAVRPPQGAFPFAPSAAPAPRAALPPSAAPPAQLMMPASLGASTCRLTIEQFASLSAEVAINPGAAAQVRGRYGLDEMSHMAESGVWHRRFSADKELFTRYSALYQSYREWLAKQQR